MMFSIGPRTAHSTRSVQLLFLNCFINTAHINALTVAAVKPRGKEFKFIFNGPKRNNLDMELVSC